MPFVTTPVRRGDVPPGGASGQVLTKDSDANWDYSWKNSDGTDGININGILSGVAALTQGQDYVDVVFGSTQPTSDWVILGSSVFNTSDVTPLNIWPGIVTSKTQSGFRLQLNGAPDTANYYVSWSIQGVFGYYLTGTEFGMKDNPSVFTVFLPGESTLSGTAIITPSDGGAGGAFNPSTVTLSVLNPVATFTYTPSTYGFRSITAGNNRGMANPPQVGFTSTASTYTLSGPASGYEGLPSGAFTVQLPVGASISGVLTITPNDASNGGTFTPATVQISTSSPSATFTYTAASSGNKTIGTTNNGGLSDPSPLSYTSNVLVMPPDIAGLKLWLKADSIGLTDGTTITSWADSSSNGYNLTSGSATFKTNIVNGKPVVRFDGISNNLSASGSIGVSQPDTIFIVGKQPFTAARCGFVWTGPGAPQIALVENTTGNFGLYAGTAEIQDASNHSGEFHVFTGIFSGSNGTGYVDGSLVVGPGSVGSAVVGTVHLMTDGGTTFFPGDIAEVVIYNSALSGTDRGNIEAYLKAKYATP